MRTLGLPFCEVCKEAHVLSFYAAAGVSSIESWAPAELAVDYARGTLAFFDVLPKTPNDHDLELSLYLDGVWLDEDGAETIILDTNALGGRTHTLEAVAVDNTLLCATTVAASWRRSSSGRSFPSGGRRA